MITLDDFQNSSLPGLVEFFMSAEDNQGLDNHANWRGVKEGHPLDKVWRYLLSVWTGEFCMPLDGGRSKPQDIEFFSLNSEDMVLPDSGANLRLHEFEARLVRGGMLAGMPPKLSYGLASVVHELIENVFQHSDGDIRCRFQGVAGYHSTPNHFSFSVSDLGLGTLTSLRLSPHWKHLGDDKESLDAIVSREASRKPNLENGEGFKTVIKNLIDRNTFIQLRSGSASVRLKGTGGGRLAEWHVAPYLKGLHVSAIWAMGGIPEEKDLFD